MIYYFLNKLRIWVVLWCEYIENKHINYLWVWRQIKMFNRPLAEKIEKSIKEETKGLNWIDKDIKRIQLLEDKVREAYGFKPLKR